MSDFGALSVGLSGLLAHRKALDTAGHNLANVNTPGYSRQRVDLSAQTNPVAATIFAGSDGVGKGVMAGTAYRLHDQFTELRALQEHAQDSSLKQSQAVLSQIESAVNEPSDTGLSAQINTFMAAWHDVANNPADLASRRQLIETAGTLTAAFGQLDSSLSTLAGNANFELSSSVVDVNTTATQVADLNTRILASVNADMPSGDLMDQRDALIQKLSEQVGATVRQQGNGVIDVYVGTTALVRGDKAEPLRVDATTTPGVTAVVWDRLGVPATAGGSIGALQASVNTTIPSYRAQLTAVEQQLTTDVNTIHATGFDLNGTAGGAFFVMGPTGISVNPTITADPKKLAVASTATGLRDGSVAAKIGQLTAPGDLYNTMVLHLGIESRTVNRQVATQSAVTDQVDAAREAMSGVNIDEEMTNMVAIQHAYDASARFITAVDSMLETLIKSTGLVGR
jgi:flagellar hook-associated protein 1